ncbi:MAG TPA: hypothetical protein VH593_09940, partial [Ktedonobacteraceae bacterium]
MDYTKTTLRLHDFIEQESGVSLTKVANHYKFGDEFAGPCPFCGTGDDRFRAWDGDGSTSGKSAHYWCRVCGAEGSPAQFLREYRKKLFGSTMTWQQVYTELGLEGETSGQLDGLLTPYKLSEPPSKAWQEAGMVLVEWAEHYLYSGQPDAAQALDYLYERGFKDETIKRARLGYVPPQKDGSWFREPFSRWGLDPERLSEKQRERGCVRVPPGILIPWFCGGKLWKLAVKRLDAPKGQDYGQILGSADGLYGIDDIEPEKPVMLVEGEFDRLSMWQEAGDMVIPVATGSTKKGHHMRWVGSLAIASYALVSFDNDEPDKQGAQDGDRAAQYWLEILPRAMRWSPWADKNTLGKGWRFKDTNDMLRYAGEFRAFCG